MSLCKLPLFEYVETHQYTPVSHVNSSYPNSCSLLQHAEAGFGLRSVCKCLCTTMGEDRCYLLILELVNSEKEGL